MAGVKKGWGSFLWIVKIIIPVSFLVALLQWTGWLYHLDFLLKPLMSQLNLPPEAVIPIVSGLLINMYGAIAAMTAIPFTLEQMTLMAVFTLLAHNLIAEGIVQHKSGINVIKITLIRIITAVLAVLIVSRFLGDASQSVAVAAELPVRSPLVGALSVWVRDTAELLMKILVIIMFIMMTLETSRALGWIEYVIRFFRPLMLILGLPSRAAASWITAVLFGLMYGGAVIVEEARRGALTKAEMERLHISLALNHAIVEDPALFLALGLPAFWLWVPKLVVAIVAVQAHRAISSLIGRLVPG